MAPKMKGYVDPLLSGYAVDYSGRLTAGMVGIRLFPITRISKPDSKFKYYDLQSYVVPETSLGANGGRAKRIDVEGELLPVNARPFGLELPIEVRDTRHYDNSDTERKRSVRLIVNQLEADRERRIHRIATTIAERNTALAGDGGGVDNKWSGTGGDPIAKIEATKDLLAVDPNTMIISKDVYRVLRNHPDILDRIGQLQNVRKVTPDALAQVFDVEKVLIASAQLGSSNKKNKNKTVGLTQIWSGEVCLAYVSEQEDDVRAGGSFMVDYPEADNNGIIVRRYDEDQSGLLGAEVVFAGMDAEEKVVCPECIYALTSIL